MAEESRQLRQFTVAPANLRDGDCEADPVPALWYQDDDDMFVESGLIDRFWLPLAVAVLAGWGGISYMLVSSFGWVVVLAIAGVVIAGSAAAVALVKTGGRVPAEVPTPIQRIEPEEQQHFRNAA